MTAFRPVPDEPEAHPAHTQYIAERQLSDGTWRFETIHPTTTPDEAETHVAWQMAAHPDWDYRIVRQTITSTVIATRTVLGTPDQP